MFPLQTLAFTAFFRKCGEKSETAERNSIFGNKTAGRRSLKQGSGRQFSVFHRTFGIARRKYAANSDTSEHTPFFRNKMPDKLASKARSAHKV